MCHYRLWADFQPLLLILDTLHVCDCLTQRLWHFIHNFQLNLTHCGDIFSSGKNPWSYVMSGTFVHVFPQEGKLFIFYNHFILQTLFRVSVNERLISALRSFVHIGCFGLSPHSVHLLHPFQKLWFCMS